MQYDNYLLVSDNEDHCITVFDRDVNFVYKFGKKGQGEPRCLSVNKAGHLAPVVQRLDNAIHWINHYPADKC